MPITRADSQPADEVVQNLATTYYVTLVQDWGQASAEDGSPLWRDGEWSMDELHTLQQGITDLAAAMGGPDRFAHNVGHITISQEAIRYRGLASSGGVKFTTSPISIDLWTVVHELSHVWDAHFRWRLSVALERYTGGYTNWMAMQVKRWRTGFDAQRRLPGCNRFGYYYGDIPPAGSDANFNRKEDFAESVAAYVYPKLVQPRVDRFKDDPQYCDVLYYADYTQTRRWSFVDGLIKGTIVAG
jgi:hypothetical protein